MEFSPANRPTTLQQMLAGLVAGIVAAGSTVPDRADVIVLGEGEFDAVGLQPNDQRIDHKAGAVQGIAVVGLITC